jgi:sugar lactone lactonase YvrE
MVRKGFVLILVMLSLGLLVSTAVAQDENIIASGLNYPRGLAYDEDGNLFIAEAGSGGETIVVQIEDVEIRGGLTGQVTKVAPDGTASVAVGSLPSIYVPAEGAGLGVYRVVPSADSLWLVFSEAQNMTVFSDAVVEIDKTTLRVKTFIDLYAYEAANNPDGTEEILSNPGDVAIREDGTAYIVDTGANTLYSWTEAGGLQVVHAWTDNPVPTSIDFADDGSFYISFLGTGIAPMGAKIEHWSADGSELIETFEGLTGCTDVLVSADGSIYAVQLYTVTTEQGPDFASGNVVQVTSDGLTPVIENLTTPFGLAQASDGDLVVSTNTAFADPNTGTVIQIPMSS